MVSVIFFGIMLLGISIMGLWSGREDQRRGRLQRVPVYRRRNPRRRNWPAVCAWDGIGPGPWRVGLTPGVC